MDDGLNFLRQDSTMTPPNRSLIPFTKQVTSLGMEPPLSQHCSLSVGDPPDRSDVMIMWASNSTTLSESAARVLRARIVHGAIDTTSPTTRVPGKSPGGARSGGASEFQTRKGCPANICWALPKTLR